jgi:hypothetical protein
MFGTSLLLAQDGEGVRSGQCERGPLPVYTGPASQPHQKAIGAAGVLWRTRAERPLGYRDMGKEPGCDLRLFDYRSVIAAWP